MIVLDASAAVAALLNDGPARTLLQLEQVHVPHLADVEVVSAVRRLVLSGAVEEPSGRRALETWARLGVVRYEHVGLLSRVWELRDSVSSYDATYVALAEALGCPLVTADKRLSLAPGLRCAVTLLAAS